MEGLGVRGVGRNIDDPSVINFARSDRGNFAASTHKGIAWAPNRVEPIVSSLDDPKATVGCDMAFYRPIEGSWYLFLIVVC